MKIMKLPFDNQTQASECLRREISKIVYERGGTPSFDAMLNSIIEEAAGWMCDEKKKVLVLCGALGNGKTTLMDAIVSIYNGAKMQGVNGYVINFTRIDSFDIDHATSQRIDEIKRVPLLALDDIGLENNVSREYGNERVPFVEIMYKRYEINCITVITTNLTPEMMRKRYGEKVADRLAETAEFVPFKNTTFRRQ